MHRPLAWRLSSRTLSLVALLALGCAAPAGLPGWTRLGERTVSPRVERDVIAVGARAGRFERVKLAVSGRAVTFHDVEVHYVDGTRQDVALRQRVPVGGETRAVDLAGQDRRIARVVFVYETVRTRDPRDPRAVVSLYGWR
ncbi:MAG TPA: hypothetical protein VF576_10320 [Rubricoccaceae bacterium]|jgi:hypothetical protein